MKQLNLIQGSEEWLTARAHYFCASEAPIIMGVSDYMSRTELLKNKTLGTDKEVSPFVKNLFERGHDAESKARPIVEKMIGDELFPVVGIDEERGLLASFDGITLTGECVFEHKLWNEKLAANVKCSNLPEKYYWQLEHQLLVSKAEKVIFVVSDGTEQNMVWMEYTPVEGRAEQLISGWKQFETDLMNYRLDNNITDFIGKSIMELPPLVVELSGTVSNTNLSLYESKALDFIQSINTNLSTDQDFADAEVVVKFCADAEKKLDLAKKQALANTEQIDLLFRTIDNLRSTMRDKRLELEKRVKSRKDEIRLEIIQRAKADLTLYISVLNNRLGTVRLPEITANFSGAIKGKRNIESLQSAVADELARAKIEADLTFNRYVINLDLFNGIDQADKSLFADINQIINKDHEHLKLIIEQRISKQKEIEATKKAIQETPERSKALEPVITQNGQTTTSPHDVMNSDANPIVAEIKEDLKKLDITIHPMSDFIACILGGKIRHLSITV